jgi:hypothetical protein
MDRTYRLEFNEKQQHFHLDNFTHEEGTHGWVTILARCTDNEFKILESFVNRVPHERLTKEYILRCAMEVECFMINLLEHGLVIGRPH